MLPSDLTSALTGGLNGVYFLVKLIFLILAAMYFVFSIIVAGQIDLMSKTLVTKVSPLIRLLSWAMVAVSLGVVVVFFRFL